MKQSIFAGILVSVLSSAAADLNYDDHARALQRGKDLKEMPSVSAEKANALTSLIQQGRLKRVDRKENIRPEYRFLKKNGAAPKGSNTSTGTSGAPAKGAPKKSSTNTSGGNPKTSSRNAPPNVELNTVAKKSPSKPAPKGGRKSNTHQTGRAGHDVIDEEDHLPDSGGSFDMFFLSGFQDAQGLQGAVPPNPNLPDDFDAGTVYLWNFEPVYGLTRDDSGNSTTTADLVDEADRFASVTGKCTRTDPHDELDVNYVGRAYCQFTYSDLLEASELNAEGPVQIGEAGVLSITGGTYMFEGVIGEIRLTPVVSESLEEDFGLDLPASYLMEAFFYLRGAGDMLDDTIF